MLAPAAAVFSLLLLLTGVAKIVRPKDVESALASLGIPRVHGLGIVLGVVEVVVGFGALFLSALLVVQGFLYLSFGVWVALAIRNSIPIASCGCLGRPDTPPTVSHLVLNILASVISIGAVFGEPMRFDLALGVMATVAVVLAGVFLSYVILTDAAHLSGVRNT